jgi:tetratricopeptide (TPR) repeat protein
LALEHDPELPLALGMKASSFEMPVQAAIDTLSTLVHRYPNDPELFFLFSTLMSRIGDCDREAVLMTRAVTLDPLSPVNRLRRVRGYIAAGRFDDAAQDARRAEQQGLPMAIYLVQAALLAGDANEARFQLERPDADWTTGGASHWRGIMAAHLARLEGDTEAVSRALAPVESRIEEQAYFLRFHVAVLKDDIPRAVEYYRTALHEREWAALLEIQGTGVQRRLFPEFFASEGYEAILRDYELDKASIAKLIVPPLPVEVATTR